MRVQGPKQVGVGVSWDTLESNVAQQLKVLAEKGEEVALLLLL